MKSKAEGSPQASVPCEVCGRENKPAFDGPHGGPACARGFPVEHPAGMAMHCYRLGYEREKIRADAATKALMDYAERGRPSGGAPHPAVEALRALRQQVEDTIGAAQTDSDGEWITAYHFKTGAIHRLLALARDTVVDAGLVYRTAQSTEAAAATGSRLVGQDACTVKAPTPTERAERSALSEEGIRRAAVLMAIRVLGTDWTAKHDRLIEEVEDLAAEFVSEQPPAGPPKALPVPPASASDPSPSEGAAPHATERGEG